MKTVIERAHEAAARAINPRAWEIMDDALRQTEKKYAGQNVAWPADQFKHRESMDLARAAVSAFLSTLAKDEEAVEGVARVICAGQGLNWKDQFSILSSNGDPEAHEAFRHDARAALAALMGPG